MISLNSMTGPSGEAMHGNGIRHTTIDGVKLEIEQNARGSDNVNCNVFVISDSQSNIVDRQLESVQY